MNLRRLCLDLASRFFSHGTASAQGVVSKVRRRSPMMQFFTQLPPCLIAGGLRRSTFLGPQAHRARSHGQADAPSFVKKPYLKTNQNDARMLRRSATAVGRANMALVASRPPEQQRSFLPCTERAGFVRARTPAQASIARAVAGGTWVGDGEAEPWSGHIPDSWKIAENGFQGMTGSCWPRLLDHFSALGCAGASARSPRATPGIGRCASRRLEAVPGIAPDGDALVQSSDARTSRTKAGTSSPGWAWCPGSIPAAASPCCSASVNRGCVTWRTLSDPAAPLA